MHSPVVRFVLLTILLLPARADEFDRLRMKWRDMLTGGAGVDSSIPQMRQRLASIESEASKN